MEKQRVTIPPTRRSEVLKEDLKLLYSLTTHTIPFKQALATKGFGVDSCSISAKLPFGQDGVNKLAKKCRERLRDHILGRFEGPIDVYGLSGGYLLIVDEVEGLLGYVSQAKTQGALSYKITGHNFMVKTLRETSKGLFSDIEGVSVIVHLFEVNRHENLRLYEDRVRYMPPNPKMNALYPTFDVDAVIEDIDVSDRGIYFLMGPPGTGKSTFIRYAMSRLMDKSNAEERDDDAGFYLTDAQSVVMHPEFLSRVRTLGRGSVLVIEDVDQLLAPRKDGNGIMSNLLSITSGLIEQDLSIIITTNQPSLKHVDEALLRPGRTREILEFKPYEADKIPCVLDALGYGGDFEDFSESGKDRYTLAELTDKKPDKVGAMKSIGFKG